MALWIGDLVLPVVSIAVIFILYLSRKCDLAIFLAWWAGLVLGALWEFSFFFLGKSWTVHGGCQMVDGVEICLSQNPLPQWYLSLAHSIEDAGIFMIGVGLAWLILGGNKRRHFTRWHWGELGIMWIWGAGSEWLIYQVSNGRSLFFIPNKFNPTYLNLSWFTPDDQTLPYTIIPDAIWWVAPIVFYVILLGLKSKWDGQYFRQEPVAGEPLSVSG